MKRMVMMLTVTLVVGIAVGMVAAQVLMAQQAQAPITRTILQQKDIEGLAEREVVMYVADVMPGAVVRVGTFTQVPR